ncbi:MAG: tetratricopeptide repeat protein [Spirochaetia bacterium]|nr:tetratricopeptide repeat protein [Spirochaetia bacterium]
MKIFYKIIIYCSVYFIVSTNLFSSQDDELEKKLNIKMSQYYNQKKYEAVIIIGNKLLQKTSGKNKKTEDLLINSYKQQIEALINTRQASVLYNNNQILQAKKTIDKAESISPDSEIILNIKSRIYNSQMKINPMANIDPAKKEEFDKLLVSATDALNRAKNEEALGLFAKALLIVPGSPEAIEGYNLALVRTNKENSSGRVHELLVKADQLIVQTKYTDAINVFDEVLNYDPINTYAINKKNELNRLIKSASQNAQKQELAKEYLEGARQHEEKNEYNLAIEKYNLGFGLLPEFAPWKQLIKLAEKKQKENEEKKFSRSLDDIAKSYQKGIYYLASEEFSRAITEFDTVISISKQYGQEQTRKQAEEFLQKARDNFNRKEEEVVGETNPYYKMINNTKILGLNAYNKKEYKAAKEYFASILELFPKNRFARIYFVKSDIELQPGSKNQIIQNFISNIKSSMESEPAEAKRLLTISREIFPNDPELKNLYDSMNVNKQNIIKKSTIPINVLNNWYDQAFAILTQENDSKKANDLLTKIINADPTYIKAITLKARIEGRTQIAEVRAISPDAQKHYSEGLWHYGQGRIQEAKNSFEQALTIEPNYQNAKNAREKCIKYLQQSKGT